MAAAWLRWRDKGAPGILWMDPDVVADPSDLEAMHQVITYRPDTVWVAAHKLWPASTNLQDWVWGFGGWDDGRMTTTRNMRVMPGWFALGFTYTPAALLQPITSDLAVWVFGQVDMGLSAAARALQVPIRVANQARPRHVHFIKRPGDAGYRP